MAAAAVAALGVVVAAIVGYASSEITSDDQLTASREAQDLDLRLANMKRQDTLKSTREQMLFNRQSLKQQKQLTMLQLGQQQKQFQQTQIGNELQNRLNYFNSMLAGKTQLQNNLANHWRRK